MEERAEKQLEGVWHYGRYYSKVMPRKYLWPIDEKAQDGMDILHKFYLELKNGHLFESPLKKGSKRTLRVLDLGTGTSIWAIDVATNARSVSTPLEVMAIDVNMIQPQFIPPQVTTLQLDITQTSWGPSVWGNCDLIHIRQLYGSILPHLWESVYRNAYLHLKHGSGYIEHVEIDWTARWAEDVPTDSPLQKWSEYFREGMARLGRSLELDGPHVRNCLHRAGFVGIQVKSKRCFLSSSFSGNRIKAEKWLNVALRRNLEGYSMMPLIEGLGWSKERCDAFCAEVEEDILNCSTSAHFMV
ncbi:hypothetical protein E4U42_000635 [Claviceps africana]|uniref:S-adenosyl-L-methionine-dependent methyltransferase n=1 Tax=Claviceps africana TaxID=83212 RepID=A0A8K0J9T3_9HYPO|nr:hypothetical protein E4U42_000635 [Claviceps africana]